MQLIRMEHFITVRGRTDMDHIRKEDITDNGRQRNYYVALGRVLARSITYSDCVFVDLVISMQCACAILSFVTGLALPYFPLIKGTIF
jgi:hypothetical protein